MARNDGKYRKQKQAALRRALVEAGGPSELAKFINENYSDGISVQGIFDWKICPPLRAGQVAAAVAAKGGSVTVRELCPDFAAVFEQAA